MANIAKTTIEKRAPGRLWIPFSRVLRGTTETGNEFRMVEGFAYANATVGDGWNLTREAMVAASDGYMRWGAVREMHQPSAVGTAIGSVDIDGETFPLGVTWDGDKAFLRTKIVDPDAILKLDEGIYRGYSVGVRFKVIRGDVIESCDWIENSLVDRPADPGAVITLIRADQNVDAKSDVIRYWDASDNWVEGPYTFGQRVPDLKKADILADACDAWWALIDSLRSLLPGGDTTLMRRSVDEFGDYLKTEVIGEMDAEATDDDATRAAKREAVTRSLETAIARRKTLADAPEALNRATTAESALSALQAERTALVTERDSLKTDLATVTTERETLRTDLATQRSEVERLTGILQTVPDPKQPKPSAHAVDRTFAADQWNPAKPVSERVQSLKDEFDTLARTLKNEPDAATRQKGVQRMQMIKAELSTLGEGV